MTLRDKPGPATAALYRPLLDSVPDALVLVSPDGLILLANAQADEMFGYARGELTGMAVDLLVPERLRGRHPAHRNGFFSRPSLRPMGARGELFGLRKDGTEFAIAINLAPVQTQDGLVVSAAIRDVSDTQRIIREQRELQEQLKRKNDELEEQYRRVQEINRLKSEFLANMSHELRTPLNAVIGFSEILYDGKAGEMPAHQREFTADILNSARHLLQLINDVLDLAKVEAGKMEFSPQPLQLPKIVSEVRDVVRTLVARKRLRLSAEIDPGLGELVLDVPKLKQVLYNYLSNAIKFTPEEGSVVVRGLPEGPDRFRLEVTDTGIGIRPEDLRLLFVEFQQLDTSMTKKYQGTGLGLALTKRIVEAQGGQVGVTSTPGRGSTFYAVLPRRSEGRQEAPAPRRSPPIPGAPVILVIEDNPQDAAQIDAALTAGGYAVEHASTGQQAVALCRERSYAGITLDLLLPDESGWSVLHALRTEGPNANTPVIVVSIVADRAAAAVFAVQDYLVKPASPGEIVRALRRCGVATLRRVLMVECDAAAATLLRGELERAGYDTLHAGDAEAALRMTAAGRPDAAIVNLHTCEGGLALLTRLRSARPGAPMPVIVSALREPARGDVERLAHDAVAVVSKGHDVGAVVTARLGEMLAERASAAAGEGA